MATKCINSSPFEGESTLSVIKSGKRRRQANVLVIIFWISFSNCLMELILTF